jgi:hypothetical protein
MEKDKMQELTITWQRVTRIWWLILWRHMLGAAILGGAIGAVVGGIEGGMGLSGKMILVSSALAGVIVNIAWSLVVVRMALRKRYIDFQLVLISRNISS